MEVYGSFKDAADRNWLTEIDTITEETMRGIRQAATETSSKRIECISHDEVIDIQTLSGRLAAALYLGDQEIGALLREMFEKDSFYSSEKIDRRCVWYSGDITPGVKIYTGDGRWDPLAEVIMSPAVTSLGEAVRAFMRIFVKPYLGFSPEPKFAEKIAEAACRAVCDYSSQDSHSYAFPLVTLHELLLKICSFHSCLHSPESCEKEFDAPVANLLGQIADAGDFIVMPVRECLIDVSKTLCRIRQEANAAGVLSVWRGTRRYMFLDVDELPVPTMKALTSLMGLYGLSNHTLIEPQKWLGGTKYEFFKVLGAEQCGPTHAENSVPSAFPSKQLLDLRKKLIGAMEPGEEHCLTEIRLKDDWLPSGMDDEGNVTF